MWWGENDGDVMKIIVMRWEWWECCENDVDVVRMMGMLWEWWGCCENNGDVVRIMGMLWEWWGYDKNNGDKVRMRESGYILQMTVTYLLTDLLTKENPEMLSHLKTVYLLTLSKLRLTPLPPTLFLTNYFLTMCWLHWPPSLS